MSDLADAVFGGQLLGHVIAGDELTASVVHDAALKASLVSDLFPGHEMLQGEHQVLAARIAEDISGHHAYTPSDMAEDVMRSHIDSEIAGPLMDH